ncbi:MAG: transcriptional regulator, TetR family [Thermoleophilia bacterium]|nr:transcriptional regulator, TetR family [Thermoleophilia bacterium]
MVAAVIVPVLRADAARNRARVLEAAVRLLGERGLEVTMQEIADAAGVGVGTVFRRFATKDDLVSAVVEDRVHEMLDLAREALDCSDASPFDAFASCFVAITELHVRHRGVMEALAGTDYCVPVSDAARGELRTCVGALIERAIDDGAMRRDVRVDDIPSLVCAISRLGGSSGDARIEGSDDTWRRACTIFLDGLRVRA